jgi:hypothetical protein
VLSKCEKLAYDANRESAYTKETVSQIRQPQIAGLLNVHLGIGMYIAHQTTFERMRSTDNFVTNTYDLHHVRRGTGSMANTMG